MDVFTVQVHGVCALQNLPAFLPSLVPKDFTSFKNETYFMLSPVL